MKCTPGLFSFGSNSSTFNPPPASMKVVFELSFFNMIPKKSTASTFQSQFSAHPCGSRLLKFLLIHISLQNSDFQVVWFCFWSWPDAIGILQSFFFWCLWNSRLKILAVCLCLGHQAMPLSPVSVCFSLNPQGLYSGHPDTQVLTWKTGYGVRAEFKFGILINLSPDSLQVHLKAVNASDREMFLHLISV